MKLSILMRRCCFFLLIVFLIQFSLCLKIKNKIKNKLNKPFFDEEAEMANSNRIPIIHLHVEDNDNDPINFRRFDGERQSYNFKLNDLTKKYESEKHALLAVIGKQLTKIAELTEMADSTNKLIKELAK